MRHCAGGLYSIHDSTDGSITQYIRYVYDESSSVVGISLKSTEDAPWTEYYFAKNLQGDVMAVYQESNSDEVASYTYDAWGNIISKSGNLADLNPFRYRGYYYDTETGLYYVSSRYYDPEIGRFLNADNNFVIIICLCTVATIQQTELIQMGNIGITCG